MKQAVIEAIAKEACRLAGVRIWEIDGMCVFRPGPVDNLSFFFFDEGGERIEFTGDLLFWTRPDAVDRITKAISGAK